MSDYLERTNGGQSFAGSEMECEPFPWLPIIALAIGCLALGFQIGYYILRK